MKPKSKMFKKGYKGTSLLFALTLAINPTRLTYADATTNLGTRREEENLIHESCSGSEESLATYGCSIYLLQLIKDPRVALDLRVKALIHLGVKCRSNSITIDECLRASQELEKAPIARQFNFPFQNVFGSLTQNKFSQPSVGGPFEIGIIEASADHGAKKRK